MTEHVLEVKDLRVVYIALRGLVKAVDSVSFYVNRGEVLGIVGESGCGKTTLAMSILRALPPNARVVEGSIVLDGIDILRVSEAEFDRKFRWRKIALVPQAALNALNPVMKIIDHFLETAQARGVRDRRLVVEKASKFLEMVRLDPERVLKAYPHELSGGMRQRVLIALALFLEPEIVLLDEPTTALDVLTQRFILDLLKELHQKTGNTMIFITHDIAIVADLADRMAVMYAGKLVEIGDVYTMFREPKHPYTMALIKSVPSLVGRLEDMKPIPGTPPDLINPPPGCRFHPRCPYAMDICRREEPPMIEVGKDHFVWCWLHAKR